MGTMVAVMISQDSSIWNEVIMELGRVDRNIRTRCKKHLDFCVHNVILFIVKKGKALTERRKQYGGNR